MQQKTIMRILFISDNLSKGGGGISSFWLKEKLKGKGIKVFSLFPKRKENFLSLFWRIRKLIIKKKIDLIHCQNKNYWLAVLLVKKIFRKPAFLTLRDYKGICSYGFCLYQSKKKCNLFSFYKKDFLYYYQNYIRNKNFFSFVRQFFLSYAGWLKTLFLGFLFKQADKLICVSRYVKRVYSLNRYPENKMEVIYNLPPKMVKKRKLDKKIFSKLKKRQKIVIYGGKLSLGKGADLLIRCAKEIIKKDKTIFFIFCGKRFYPIKKINNPQIIFLKFLRNQDFLHLIKNSDLVCIPSRWPEPLSRITFEAFYFAKPVLSTNVGGQKEVINNQHGWLVEAKEEALLPKLKKALLNKKLLIKKGLNAKKFILKLEEENLKKIILLYKKYI